MSIKSKLLWLLAGLALALFAASATGYIGVDLVSAKTRTIVVDRLEPIEQLTTTRKGYRSIAVRALEAGEGIVTFDAATADIIKSRDAGASNWAAYLATYLTPEETKLAELTKVAMVKSDAAVAQLLTLLSSHDQAALVAFNQDQTDIAPVLERLDSLVDLQVRVSHEEYSAAQSIWNFVTAALLAVGGVSLMMLAFAATTVLRGVAGPLAKMEGAMRRLAAGDLSVVVPFVGRRDEVGAMASAVQVFKEAGLSNVRLTEEAEAARTAADAARVGSEKERAANDAARLEVAAHQEAAVSALGKALGKLAEGQLQTIDTAFAGELEGVRGAFNQTVSKLSEIVRQLRETSGTLKTATGEILSGTNDLADRTSKQAAAIEETSAAMEQLASTVAANAQRAETASLTASSVSATAEATGEVMSRSNDAMARISNSSAKISNIIGLIDDIAFQTNLLALNASVEAARAGDAGKGFAVVAVEVRRLAQSAASASSDVKVLIEELAREVSGGSRLVAEAAEKLSSMLEGVRESAALISDMAAASQEQSSAISEVTTAIREMDEMTQHNAALVEQTNAAIEQTEQQASSLDQIVEVFVVRDGTVRVGVDLGRQSSKDVRGLQARARSFASRGAAVKMKDWAEF